MGVPVETMVAMARFFRQYNLTSYDDVMDLVTKAEAAMHGD